MFRIGQGTDVHAFAPERKLILGGIEIPNHPGLYGHSDADVILHAICDALLGSIALGDIGMHFSDKDPKYKNMDSSVFLIHCMKLLKNAGYTPVNLDVTVLCETPKISPHSLKMRQKIASLMNLEITDISIKATTSEKMGFTGRKEGILANAVVLVTSHPKPCLNKEEE